MLPADLPLHPSGAVPAMPMTILHGDCIEQMRLLDAESVDALVSDPPYGIGFMGREWDTFKPSVAEQKQGLRQINKSEHYSRKEKRAANPNLKGRTVDGAISSSQIEYDYSVTGLRAFQAWTELWAREAFRVLKPGAHAVVCGAPRAYHRMASGLEDAGFEIRDCLAWLFGSGFPKSLNLGEGLGTALKPAHEPIVLARKPFKGTVKGNVEKFGTGALNIDAARIGDEGGCAGATKGEQVVNCYGKNLNGEFGQPVPGLGRWPANVALDEIAAMVLDEQSGELVDGVAVNRNRTERAESPAGYGSRNVIPVDVGYGGSGGASRFYYVAKPSREERDYGCVGLAQRTAGECTDRREGSDGLKNPRAGAGRTGGGRNFHPTVKPVELMRWLVKLVTPINGTVIDPFLGSGTTGMACVYEQRGFIGIEKEAEYLEIARARIAAVAPLFSGAGADLFQTEPVA